MIIHTQTTNPKPDTAELLMHVKYIKDYNVFVTFTAISSTYTDKYWYRMRVYNFYATSSSAQHTLLRTPIDLEGWSNVIDAGSNYSWALDMDITNPLADSFIKPKTSTSAATDTRAQDVINKYGYYKVAYRVHVLGGKWLDWQYDTETTNGQDGYAGIFGKTIDQIEVKLVK